MVRSPYATRVTRFGSLDARDMSNRKPFTGKNGTYFKFGHGSEAFTPTTAMERYNYEYRQLPLG